MTEKVTLTKANYDNMIERAAIQQEMAERANIELTLLKGDQVEAYAFKPWEITGFGGMFKGQLVEVNFKKGTLEADLAKKLNELQTELMNVANDRHKLRLGNKDLENRMKKKLTYFEGFVIFGLGMLLGILPFIYD